MASAAKRNKPASSDEEDSPPPSPGPSSSTAAKSKSKPGSSKSAFAASLKQDERKERLAQLRKKMDSAHKQNRQAVMEEDKRSKLPANWEQKQERVKIEEEVDAKKKECEEAGDDYEREKMLGIGADDSSKWHRKRDKKGNPDLGFSCFEDMTRRQYTRLTKQMKPDMKGYESKKAGTSDELFYPTVNTLGVSDEHKDSEEAVNGMVDDLEKQIAKRGNFHRRRIHDEEADIDYINSRNAKFNSKLERFYGKYTTETKQNLERGTAI